jgi:hypothetical protein
MSNASRDYKGQYDFSADMNMMCRCGHRLGTHAGDNETGKRPCFNEDTYGDPPYSTGQPCDCEHFKPAKVKAPVTRTSAPSAQLDTNHGASE